ncbi:orotate phosphoribosyltransferase [Thermovenabulum sp.]|uniref:orotate phosphoribosyltransferase n=1 Tax=Thermovenabulum sp. TaxID=3100335 RepID=UPI003C7E1BF7
MDYLIEKFAQLGAIKKGHFLLSSGKHSDTYIQCAKIFEYPLEAQNIVNILAQKLYGQKVDTVIGPAIGGITVAYEMARALGVRAIFAEREKGIFTLRRGFEIKEKEKLLVVEDVITTGGSAREVIDLVRNLKGEVIGVASLVDRSKEKDIFDLPFYSLVKIDLEIYDEEDCPLCKKGIPYVKPGSRELKK